MLSFLGGRRCRSKHHQHLYNDQLPTDIPGHLFKSSTDEDDFVLIGDTASERTTVGPFPASHSSLGDTDLPPSYASVQNILPSGYSSEFSQSWDMGSGASQPSGSQSGSRLINVEPASPHSNIFRNSPPSLQTSNKTQTVLTNPNPTTSASQVTDIKASCDSHQFPSRNTRLLTAHERIPDPDSQVELWRYIPFTLARSMAELEAQKLKAANFIPVQLSPLNLAAFNYSFHLEKATLNVS